MTAVSVEIARLSREVSELQELKYIRSKAARERISNPFFIIYQLSSPYIDQLSSPSEFLFNQKHHISFINMDNN
jgi:hypothetical protein